MNLKKIVFVPIYTTLCVATLALSLEAVGIMGGLSHKAKGMAYYTKSISEKLGGNLDESEEYWKIGDNHYRRGEEFFKFIDRFGPYSNLERFVAKF